jgi:hypothetical protein
MKHLTIYVLCLFTTPLYAQKGLRSKLNEEITVQNSINSTSKRFLEAKVLHKTEKTVNKFSWDQNNNIWEFSGSSTAVLNGNNEIQEETEYDINGNLTSRITYSIDATKLIACTIFDSYSNGIWVHNNKSEIEKDTEGRILREEYFYWENNDWILSNGKKTVIENVSLELAYETDLVTDDQTKTYQPILKRSISFSNGNLSEIITQQFESSAWINISAEGYDYDATGKISSIIYLTWNSNQWVNKELYTNIDWHDYAKKQLNFVELKTWDGINWNNSQKAIYQYKLNGSVSSISFNYLNNEWVYAYRLNEEYDANNNPKSYKIEQFENNNWKTVVETSIEYTYDNLNRLVQSITKLYDGQNWYNLFKEVIEFKSTTGIAQRKLELNVFPNPTTDYFTINMKEASSGTLNIYNQQGQLLISQRIENTEDKRIDISEFKAGTYIVNFISGYEVLVTKVVKSN